MTLEDVKAMSDEEIRVKVAELCGYTFKDEGSRYPDEENWQKYKAVYFGEGFIGLSKPNWIPVPNYPNDLNSCHDFEKVLKTTKEWIDYTRYLFQIIEPNWTPWEAMCAQDYEKKMHILSFVVKATARQKCEAFILTMESAACYSNTSR